ncbi:MAG TPA: AtpZ/AtpI family protein [Kofleriaceae bacterium]|nr:AtpZ/AtpI family protein [Kofleriaceae bacterium]
MSQDDDGGTVHLSRMDADAMIADPARPLPPRPVPPASPLDVDPVARSSRRMFEGLSASSAGLELGLSVGLGALFGSWLDGKLGTEPWMLVVFLILGLIAGFRGVLRAVARAERAGVRG